MVCVFAIWTSHVELIKAFGFPDEFWYFIKNMRILASYNKLLQLSRIY
jgi:hypothetical protein